LAHHLTLSAERTNSHRDCAAVTIRGYPLWGVDDLLFLIVLELLETHATNGRGVSPRVYFIRGVLRALRLAPRHL